MQISKSPAAFTQPAGKQNRKQALRAACFIHSALRLVSFAQFNDLLHLHCVSSALRNPFFVSLFLRFSLSGLYRWYGNLTRSAMIPAPPYQSPRTYRTNLLPSPPAKPQLTKLQPCKLTNLSSAKYQPCKPSNPHICRPKPRPAKLQTHKSATNLQIRLPMQDIPRALPPVRNLTSP